MNFGFNSNVQVGDATYHVQTEDRGPSHPFLDTVVYLAGQVIYKRSTSYEKFARGAAGLEAKGLAAKLHERLAQQHRDVIAELEAGTLKTHGRERREVPSAGDDASDEILELTLKNPKTWCAAGHVSLEIALSGRNSKKHVGDADVQVCIEHDKRRFPCAEDRTNAEGCATLQFPMPADVAEGSSLVVRATDGTRFGELRFRLKAKAGEASAARNKTPAPVLR